MSTALRFTLDEYDRMIERDVWNGRNVRTELIFGEIREMSPPGPTHEEVIDRLTRWNCSNTNPDEVRVRIQNSIGLPKLDSAPQPDVAWVAERDYSKRRPQPRDVLLVIEVADSSLKSDRTEKAELYAKGKVADYWIVNLQDWCVEVHRGPYRQKQTYTLHETVHPLAKPAVALHVATLFAAAK